MKIHYILLITIMLLGASTSTIAQTKDLTSKKISKIDVFTPKEKDEIQVWFIEQTDSLKLRPSSRLEYGKVIETNLNAIFHLTDPQKGYRVSEIKEKLDEIFVKINKKAKPLMDNSQFEKHLLTMELLENGYKYRLNNPSKETNLYSYLKEREQEE